MLNEVNISFLGDFCPINRIEEQILKGDYSNFLDVRNILKNQDIVIANLECPITNSNNKIKKIGPNLKGVQKTTDLLNYLNINTLSLANNHILDYGQEGLKETINILKSERINYFGAGLNINEAQEPYVKEINGIKICFLNVCEREFNIAEIDKAGANPNDIIETSKNIILNRSKVDFIILIFHGGVENYNLPTPNIQKCLRYYADLGVDLIVGHHSHIVSGYEKHNSTPIFYSIGNFIFDWDNKPDFWYENIIVNVTLRKDAEIKFEIIPLTQNKTIEGVFKCEENIKEKKLKEIEYLSDIIKDENKIICEWMKYTNKRGKAIFANIFSLNKTHKRVMSKGLFPNLLLTEKKKRILFNQFFCESHRDIIFEILKK